MAKVMSRSAIWIAGMVTVLLAVSGAVWSEKETHVTTHLTIYVDPVIALEGGMVIVAGIPIPRAEWEKLPDTNALAMWDKTNPEHQQLGINDKHFGVHLTSQASAIELLYPEDGTYSFNFLNVPSDGKPAPLVTERVSVGSGTDIPDPATGKRLDWPSESVVAISGTMRSAFWARSVDTRFFVLTGPDSSKYYRTTDYAGGRIIEITEEGILKLDVKSANE